MRLAFGSKPNFRRRISCRTAALHNPGDTRKIAPCRFHGETPGPSQCGHRLGLGVPHFKRENATRFQQARECIDNDAVSIKSVGAPIEREVRLKARHLWREARDFGGRDVGRIGEDEIETLVNRLGPIALAKLAAVSEVQRLSI